MTAPTSSARAENGCGRSALGRGRGVGLQPSLLARSRRSRGRTAGHERTEAFAEMKVNQDELRHDRDEWRWRAER